MPVIRRARRWLGPYIRNVGGWRTRRKLIVIESDDWGSIRMPSRSVYDECIAAGYQVDRNPYERFDSLLSEEDLASLFGVLTGFTDRHGRHPVITANVIVANPDFDAIAADGFQRYHHEPISETFKRYPKHGRCLDLWDQGRRAGVFFPQFHGREHLNVRMFMTALQKDDPTAHFAFERGMPGCIPKGPRPAGNPYVEATRFRSESEKNEVLRAQLEGLDLFESLFGFRSRTMIPTNYTWSGDFDPAMAAKGIAAYQGAPVVKEQQADGSRRGIRRRLGDVSEAGQTYLVRNAFFEPSLTGEPPDRAIDRCLHQVEVAFRLQKPAVISSHRLNYCGFIDLWNRDGNLQALRKLLNRVSRTWPDAEFVTSEQLLDAILSTPDRTPDKD